MTPTLAAKIFSVGNFFNITTPFAVRVSVPVSTPPAASRVTRWSEVVVLINLTRLGFSNESKKLSNSLNGYLNIYKSHMMTAIRAIDFFNNVKDGKNCNEQGCKINV